MVWGQHLLQHNIELLPGQAAQARLRCTRRDTAVQLQSLFAALESVGGHRGVCLQEGCQLGSLVHCVHAHRVNQW